MVLEKSTGTLTIALLGNPNTGKSTLFTALVGVHQRVGNYPGVTVEKKTGSFVYEGRRFEVVDLPGLYSLAPRSRDEAIAVEVLVGRSPGTLPPDGVILIVDATNLERNLYLVSQVLEFGLPTVVALNMIDLAQRRGIRIDVAELERRLGVPVVPTQAHRRQGIRQLEAALARTIAQAARPGSGMGQPLAPLRSPLPERFWQEVERLARLWADRDLPRPVVARIVLDPTGSLQQLFLPDAPPEQIAELAAAKARLAQDGLPVPDLEPLARYQWIEKSLQGVVQRPAEQPAGATDRLDRVLTHPVWGVVIFAGLMAGVFQAVFAWAEPPMRWIDAAVQWVAQGVQAGLSPGPLRSLLVEGVLAGLGSLLAFLPQIMILFFFIGVLEDSGYLARAAYLMDGWMVRVGLSGKSFIPLLSSFACGVPGILATRVIDEPRARLTTILIAPLMTCSARLPVYAMLIGAFVPQQTYLGGLFHLQGLVLTAMYLLGIGTGVVVAWLLKRFWFTGPTPSFVMELPSYKWPSVRTVLYRVVERAWVFVRFAGTIILAVSILVWAGLYYPHRPEEVEGPFVSRAQQLGRQLQSWLAQKPNSPPENEEVVRAKSALIELAEQLRAGQLPLESLLEEASFLLSQLPEESVPESFLRQIEQLRAELLGAYQRQSLFGRLGRAVEPILRPLGWDWRIGIAVLASFPAREVVVATLGVIFQAGSIDPENPEQMTQLQRRLRSATWEGSEEKLFNLPVALGMLVFYTLCAQCAATLIAVRRETGSWRWTAFVFGYMTVLAYLGALLVYQITARVGFS
jgi:ferrous iron transport protein B